MQSPKPKTRSPSTDSTDHPTTRYARDVTEGRIVAGPHVRAACARHLRDLEHGHERGLTFDVAKANRALGFFPDVLRLNGGQFEGIPFELDPSQQFIVGSLFGWQRADGTRRFRTAYIEQGKGNGKSPLVAGIGLYCLIADNEPRAEIYSAAAKKDQAMILFRDAVAMVDQSPALSRVLTQSGRGDKVWNLFHSASNSFFRPISSDDSQSGPRPHVALVDEVHEHKTNATVSMMKAGQKGRRQPLLAMITNSGTNLNSVCWENHDYGVKVCDDALQDDSFFAYICALDEGDDPLRDESCWPKANPLLGVTIQPQYLRDEVRQARSMPSKASKVKRLNFCVWVQGGENFVDRPTWDSCVAQYGLERFAGCDCWLAIDLSSTTDLTAAVFVFRDADDVYWIVPFFWLPEVGLDEKADDDKVPYLLWKEQGHLQTTPGKAINKDFVAKFLAEQIDKHRLRVQSAPYDRWRIHELRQAMERQGINTIPLKEHGQGFKDMAPAIDALETAIVNGKFHHPGNPVLTWCSANAVVAEDEAGNRKFDKANAVSRIDGMVAAAMGVGAASAEPVKKASYLTRGPLLVV